MADTRPPSWPCSWSSGSVARARMMSLETPVDLVDAAGATEQEVVDLRLPLAEAGARPRARRCSPSRRARSCPGPAPPRGGTACRRPRGRRSQHVVGAGHHTARAPRAQARRDHLAVEVLPLVRPLLGHGLHIRGTRVRSTRARAAGGRDLPAAGGAGARAHDRRGGPRPMRGTSNGASTGRRHRRADRPAFTAARRLGKLLLLDTSDDGPVLGSRFGMSGKLVVDGTAGIDDLIYSSNLALEKWDRFAVQFTDGGDLRHARFTPARRRRARSGRGSPRSGRAR